MQSEGARRPPRPASAFPRILTEGHLFTGETLFSGPPTSSLPLSSHLWIAAWNIVFLGAPYYLPFLVPLTWVVLGLLGLGVWERASLFAAAAALLWASHTEVPRVREASVFDAEHEYFRTHVIFDGVVGRDGDGDNDNGDGDEDGTPRSITEAYNLHGPALFGLVPHGVFPFAISLALSGRLARLFGPPLPRAAAAGAAIHFPIFGLPASWAGCIPATAPLLLQALRAGERLIISPGGIAEIFLAEPDPWTAPRNASSSTSPGARAFSSSSSSSSSPASDLDDASLLSRYLDEAERKDREAAAAAAAAAAATAAAASKRPRTETVMLRRRKGFVRIALQAGVPLVPVYVFGHSQLLSLYSWNRSGLLERLSRWARTSLLFIRGRFLLPIPYRVGLLYVVGEPIRVPEPPPPPPMTTTTTTSSSSQPVGEGEKAPPPAAAAPYPPPELLDEVHGQFVASIQRLFDKYKGVYDAAWADRELVIV